MDDTRNMTAQQLAAIRRCEEAQRTNRTARDYRMSDTSYYIHQTETKED